jgi:hypothetical protein
MPNNGGNDLLPEIYRVRFHGRMMHYRPTSPQHAVDEPGHNLPAESGHRSHDDRTPPLVRSLYKDGQGQRIKEGKGGYRMDQAVKEIAAEEAKEIATEVKEEIAPLGAAEVISLALTAGFVMTILSILFLMLGIV